ncbi:hypothetical protein LPMP_205280 [Leishmania panamensis]|uniref:Uncharacterized protein n=1 Tax=Leishmania panamensis TaxID=5679 RepID=A0A088RQ80_LEIPA|nr:hypothetical protein LPMP_205280 [Leishmania panamensis]AIN98020.1 hypothetical protein LPMP_205280 [Leishmania panamensis]
MQKVAAAAVAGIPPTTGEKNPMTAFSDDDDTLDEREALEATDDETTNTYDEPQGDKPSPLDSGSSTTVSGDSSDWRSETGSPGDAAAVRVMGAHSASGSEAVHFRKDAKHLTYSYKVPQASLSAATPLNNASGQQQRLPVSANTSAAFPADISQVVEASTPTLPRSNLVGGPGGPSRFGPHGAATYAQGSPPPSAPQTTNTSAFYTFSDSYAILQGTPANAPSFLAAYPSSTTAGDEYSAADAPQQAPYHEVTGRRGTRTPGGSAVAATAPVTTVLVPSQPLNDEDEHARRKRPWDSSADADGNQSCRSRRIQIEVQAVVKKKYADKEDEDMREAYTSSSYSDEDSYSYSYSYSYSGDDELGDEADADEEGYEYYEEFYEEEVEEDEEDEEEPRIDMIEGDGHGHTLYDILYGTPKAGAIGNGDHTRDLREPALSDSPYSAPLPDKQKELHHQGQLHPRYVGEEDEKNYLRPAPSHWSETAGEEAEVARRRAATPERVGRHHRHHHKKSAKAYKGTDSETEHRAAAAPAAPAAGKKQKKSAYEHGEPFTEGTLNVTSKKGKANGHYGPKVDLDAKELDRVISDSESSEVPHEPVTSAAPAAKGTRAASSSSSSDAEDVDDEFTTLSRSRSRRRKSPQVVKNAKKKDSHHHHRSGAEANSGSDAEAEAITTTKFGARDSGKVSEEEPISIPSQQNSMGTGDETSENTLSVARHEDEGGSSDKSAEEENAKAKAAVCLVIKCDCCSKRVKESDSTKPREDKKEKVNPSSTCGCCSETENESDPKPRGDKKEKVNPSSTCGCCSETENESDSKETKSGLVIKCRCCSKKTKDGDAKDKKSRSRSGGVFSCLFAMCSSKKSTKDQVVDKNGKEGEKDKEADEQARKEGAKSHPTSPAESSVDRHTNSRQSNQKSHKKDEAFKGLKSPQAEQQEEEKGAAADTPAPSFPRSPAVMTSESKNDNQGRAAHPPKNTRRGVEQASSNSTPDAAAASSQKERENEANVLARKKSSHQPVSSPTPHPTGQARRPHSHTTPSADHARIPGKPEDPGVVIPVNASDMGENDEPGPSKRVKAQQQRSRHHGQTRAAEHPSKKKSKRNTQRVEHESSHDDSAV